MKGIILASGTGSRLYSIIKIINKHLFFVRYSPMIYHSVYKLRECGITDIIVINGKEHMDDVISFFVVKLNLRCSSHSMYKRKK